ncbi:MAG TPA: DUF4365 domain-containing protein [Gemmataceae bacterium]|nr:DUF4365 domain-containing protein [Gemmataceae bacterium]
MAAKIFGPRKRRTRQHVIADQSVNHVERYIIDAGHTAQRVEKHYGYDLLPFTYDEEGYSEPDFLSLQLKAAESLPTRGLAYNCDVDIRDYNLWMQERMPVILILFDAPKDGLFGLLSRRISRKNRAAGQGRARKRCACVCPGTRW